MTTKNNRYKSDSKQYSRMLNEVVDLRKKKTLQQVNNNNLSYKNYREPWALNREATRFDDYS